MARYPGNHTDSDLLNVPRRLKTRPGAPETHLAYITDDEADLLKEYKPGTPHEGAAGIPNYDTWGIDSSGNVTGGSTAGGGGGWSGDPGGGQQAPQNRPGGGQHQDWNQIQQDIKAEQKRKAEQKARALEAQKRVDEARKLRPPEKTQADKQADMAKAMALAYKQQQIGGTWIEEGGKMVRNPNVRYEQVSNLHNLTDDELQFLIDSGFAAAEASGTLGGVAGIEAEINKIKKQAMTGNKEEREAAYAQMDTLFAQQGKSPQETQKAVDAMISQSGYDPSGMRTWGDVESDPYLYKAHSDLLSSGLTPDKYKGYMKNISSFGHPFPTAGVGGGGGGWPGGDGGGGAGGGGGGYGPPPGYKPEQMAGFYTPQANLQQAMINVHKSPTVFKKRGGIVSLLRLS